MASIYVLPGGGGAGAHLILREHRKVNRSGPPGNSLVMRLPRLWANSVGVSDGSEVLVAFGFGDVLLIAPPGREAQIDRLVKIAGRGP